MKKQQREQWHMPFTASYRIDFMAYESCLQINPGYLLEKSSQIDILVVKKERDAVIQNGIGMCYKQHNIIEYKSPDDLQDPKYEELAETVTDLILRRLEENKQTEGVLKMNETRNLFKAEFEERDAKITELTKELQTNKQELQKKDSLIEKLKAEVVRLGGNVAAL